MHQQISENLFLRQSLIFCYLIKKGAMKTLRKMTSTSAPASPTISVTKPYQYLSSSLSVVVNSIINEVHYVTGDII